MRVNGSWRIRFARWFEALAFLALAIPALSARPLLGEPPPSAAGSEPAARRPADPRCGVLRHAKRTWVEFAPGMTPDDMLPAGTAAQEVMRIFSAEVCAALRGEPDRLLSPQRARFNELAAQGGGLEITQVLWQDLEMSRAVVELHGWAKDVDVVWRATLQRTGERWKVAAFGPRR